MSPLRTKPCPKCRLHGLIWGSSLRSVRFTIAASSLIWAILLLIGSSLIFPEVALFDPKRTTYRLMAEVMSEEWWALAFAIHGCAAMYTLLYERYNRITFTCDALYGACLWTFATISCFASHATKLSNYAPPAAMSAEVGLMLAAWWYLVRWIARSMR